MTGSWRGITAPCGELPRSTKEDKQMKWRVVKAEYTRALLD